MLKKKGCPYTFKGDARVGQSHPVLLICKGILSVALYQWHARGGINYLPLEILYLGLDVVIFEGYLNNMSESHCALFPCVWKKWTYFRHGSPFIATETWVCYLWNPRVVPLQHSPQRMGHWWPPLPMGSPARSWVPPGFSPYLSQQLQKVYTFSKTGHFQEI